MLAALCASLVLVLAAAPASPERTVKRAAPSAKRPERRSGHAAVAPRVSSKPSKSAVSRRPQAQGELARARASLAEVKRDPAKRRYRHHWEKAIAALERAARGPETGPALLDAARARYALYRFSQVDSDRARALALAARAERAGATEGRALRIAIRHEMGEEREPARPSSAPTAVLAKRPAAPAGAATGPVAARPAAPGHSITEERRAAPERPRAIVAPASPGQDATTAPPAGSVVAARPAEAATRAAGTASRVVTPGPSPAGPGPGTAPPSPRAAAPPSAATDEESSIDAILERALAGEGAAPAETAPAPAKVAELKSWSNHDYTRVAIYLSRNVSFQRVDLAAQTGRPRQVALDLRPAVVAAPLTRAVGDALVQRARAVQVDPDTVRITLDLAGREELTIFPLEEPARLIVDVGTAAGQPPAIAGTSPGSATPGAGGAGRPQSAPPDPSTASSTSSTSSAPSAATASSAASAAPSRSPAPPVLAPSEELAVRGPIRRVIVDAGHGGHDTGAIGPSNVREKDVTLAMARRLAKRLRARGYEVVLTRDDDRYLALEERTAIANARHGDLFVSLHANAHPRRDRRGVETYILNVADDRYAARLAARENGAFEESSAEIPLLRRILSDLDAKVSVESSRRVAVAVQRELCVGIRSRFGEVRDLGVKSALFYVLLGARMPAVLVETAFISNRSEEKRLASAAFQDEVAAAIARAVERVGATEARLAAVR